MPPCPICSRSSYLASCGNLPVFATASTMRVPNCKLGCAPQAHCSVGGLQIVPYAAEELIVVLPERALGRPSRGIREQRGDIAPAPPIHGDNGRCVTHSPMDEWRGTGRFGEQTRVVFAARVGVRPPKGRPTPPQEREWPPRERPRPPHPQ